MSSVDGREGSVGVGGDDPLAAYSSAVDELKVAPAAPHQDTVLRALLARDQVARRIEDDALSAADLVRLAALDDALSKRAPVIDAAHRDALVGWRRSVDPDSARWWWSLDRLADDARVRLPRWTAVVAAIVIAISFTIASDTVATLLKVAAISAGVIALVVQAALTLVAGGALTESGRRWLLVGMTRVRPVKVLSLQVLALCAGVLVVAIALRELLPRWIAGRFVAAAEVAQEASAWSRAIDGYRRALSLAPDDTSIRHKLAVALDRAQLRAEAIEELNAVVAADGAIAAAANRLARLQILGGDPRAALRVLSRLDAKTLSNPELHGYLRNQGWAKLELGMADEAVDSLNAGIRVDDERPADWYLLGEALAKLKRDDEARGAFEKMLELFTDQRDPDPEVEPEWVARAQSAVLDGSTP